MKPSPIARSLKLKAGEMIVVRTREEILSTLDQNGCLDELPFTPEMLAFCGQRLRVYKRAHKTCDTIYFTGGRSLTDTVHLQDNRCDGSAHGGCQAECLLFWKEAWLKRAEDSTTPAKLDGPGCPESRLAEIACRKDEASGEPIYLCQATQMLKATRPLPWYDFRQFWEDYTSGNEGAGRMLSVFSYAIYARLRTLPVAGKWFRKIYNRKQRMLGKPPHPRTTGSIPAGSRTPSAKLDLQPGELVRVKSFEEILKTIDTSYRNRGLVWDAEMAPYCGGTYRVKSRVEHIIDEKNGKMMQFKSDVIILEGVVCQSKYSNCRYFCPRSVYPYWREIWLERIENKPPAGAPPKEVLHK